MDLSQYKTDRNLEEGGTWLQVDDSTKLLIARSNNQNYLNELKNIIDANGMSFAAKNGKIPPEKMLTFVKKAASKTILLGWEGLTNNGKPLKYSPEEAERLFIQLPEFFGMVFSQASEMSNFLDKAEEEAIKN